MIVEVVNDSQDPVDTDALRQQGEWLISVLGLHTDCELSIALVDEERMEQLHIEWMDEPGPTDVLSFPMDDLRIPEPGEQPEPGLLGDVILCPAFAARQAVIAGHSTADELALLLTHGVLHVLGHDHTEPEEHEVMFALQAQLLDRWRQESGA